MAGNENSGRRTKPCEWFLERCREIIDEEKLVEFVGRVAAGKEQEEIIVRNGTTFDRVKKQCDTRNRLEAFKMLAEWGVGKPIQIVVNQNPLTVDDSVRNAQQIFDMIQKLETEKIPAVANGGNGHNGH